MQVDMHCLFAAMLLVLQCSSMDLATAARISDILPAVVPQAGQDIDDALRACRATVRPDGAKICVQSAAQQLVNQAWLVHLRTQASNSLMHASTCALITEHQKLNQPALA